jgi:hypothetical protein
MLLWVAWPALPSIIPFNVECGNTLLSRLPSPDGKRELVVYERNCGATTGFSTQASVLRSSDSLPQDPNSFVVIDSDHGRAPSGPGGGPILVGLWTGNDSLLVQFDRRARVFTQKRKMRGVTIHFAAVESAAVPN